VWIIHEAQIIYCSSSFNLESFWLVVHADAIITDVVQEVSRILTASYVVVDKLAIHIVDSPFTERGTRDYISLVMRYHQCKVDSSEGRFEEPEVDGDVEREWSLSGWDDLKELVSIVLESTNVKAIDVLSDRRPDTHDVIEQFLQGLCTNHTIVTAGFVRISRGNPTSDVLDKSADMLCHNIGLKRFSLNLFHTEGTTTKHSGFGNALKMNHTLQHLEFGFMGYVELDLEELVQPLIMDENGHQANSTLTTLAVQGLSAMSSVGATFARMLQKNSSIKHLDLTMSLTSESDVQELIRSLVENHSLETLDLSACRGVRGSVFPTIMDVLLVNFTLKDIQLVGTPLDAKGKHLAIKEQLQRNVMSKELHLKKLKMARPTSARVIFCGSPYAGTPESCCHMEIIIYD
jgi:hypothetical protein